ncbi:uncharacterized protein METZ01_LOCUS435512, partial [marine metagenome]
MEKNADEHNYKSNNTIKETEDTLTNILKDFF